SNSPQRGLGGATKLKQSPQQNAAETAIQEISSDEKPDYERLRLRAKAKKLAEEKRQFERYKAHPWPFLTECAYTEDPHDKSCLIKKYPNEPPLERLVSTWFRERRLLVPKSRRMLVSWTFILLHVWLLLFHEREYIFFAARKEGKDESEGSLELVKRAKFVINHLKNFTPPATDQRRGRILCPFTHSEIVAVAQGQDQMRQVTATAIFADEFAFWEKARESYAAARPTI